MTSSHSPPDSTNKYGCEQTAVHLWTNDIDKNAGEDHNGDRCYENEFDFEPKSNCQCHPSCGMCGYYKSLASASDCITCADPTTVVEAVYPDGTGYCNGKKKKKKYNTIKSSYDFSSIADNPNVVDLRIEGCFETLGGSTIYIDGENQGTIEVR